MINGELEELANLDIFHNHLVFSRGRLFAHLVPEFWFELACRTQQPSEYVSH